MQFWLKMYIFTHASVFNVVLSLKLLLMGHILWALIPASLSTSGRCEQKEKKAKEKKASSEGREKKNRQSGLWEQMSV